MVNIVGADLALRHGAIVNAVGDFIHIYQSPYGMNSTMESLYERSYNAALSLPKNCVVVCDWDRTIGSWGKKSRNSAVGTLLTLINYGFGILARELRNAQVYYVAPSAVRACLGFPPQTSKLEVHKAVSHLLPPTMRGTKFHKDGDVRGDIKDAWLLAFTYHCTRMKQ